MNKIYLTTLQEEEFLSLYWARSSPCHLRVIAGGNKFKHGTNQDEDI